jgi:hypothetical protein
LSGAGDRSVPWGDVERHVAFGKFAANQCSDSERVAGIAGRAGVDGTVCPAIFSDEPEIQRAVRHGPAADAELDVGYLIYAVLRGPARD